MEVTLWFFLILMGYTLIYNLGMAIPAKLFGVRIDQFFVGYNPWFSLLEIKVKETLYGLGWLPLGGFVKLAGMELEEEEEIKSYHFEYLSKVKQIIVLGGGPFISLIVALMILTISGEINVTALSSLGLKIVGIAFVFYGLYQLLTAVIKQQKSLHFWSLALIYVIALFLIGICIAETTTFLTDLQRFFQGTITLKTVAPNFSNEDKMALAGFLGIFHFLLNLLPLGGLNGWQILTRLHQTNFGKLKEGWVLNVFLLLSVLLPLIGYGWIVYLFFLS